MASRFPASLSRAERKAVYNALSDEFMSSGMRPSGEVTERGLIVEDLFDALLPYMDGRATNDGNADIGALRLTTVIDAPIERCFDLSCDIDVHRDSMAASRERAVSGITSGCIGLGEEVTWEARHFGLRWRVTSRITELDRPRWFVDEMQRGPFASFRHEHRFHEDAVGMMTIMVDVVMYRLPLGPLGKAADKLVVRRYLTRLLDTRNRYIKDLAERPRP